MKSLIALIAALALGRWFYVNHEATITADNVPLPLGGIGAPIATAATVSPVRAPGNNLKLRPYLIKGGTDPLTEAAYHSATGGAQSLSDSAQVGQVHDSPLYIDGTGIIYGSTTGLAVQPSTGQSDIAPQNPTDTVLYKKTNIGTGKIVIPDPRQEVVTA